MTLAIAENGGFEKPSVVKEKIQIEGQGGQHQAVLENFAAAILKGEPLIAPAAEGLRSVELCNAMLLSTWRDKKVTLPISGRSYAKQLKQRAQNSRFEKVVKQVEVVDMNDTF